MFSHQRDAKRRAAFAPERADAQDQLAERRDEEDRRARALALAVNVEIERHAVREYGFAARNAPTRAQHRGAGGPLVADTETVDAFVAVLDAAHDRAHSEAQA